MFGIKTKLKKIIFFLSEGKKLTSDNKVRRLMRHFRVDEYGHRANYEHADLGYGWLHYGFLRSIKPNHVLCVGSRHGYIPSILAQACKDNGFGSVDFVDAGFGEDDENNWTGEGYWKTKSGEATFLKFDLHNFITLHVMTTDQFKKKLGKKIKYDYIYIDGDHSYKGVTRDYDLFWPTLRSGGFMSFHDVSIKGTKTEGEYGVWKLWKKISKKNALTFDYLGSGLGIIQKK
jgi:hypothetical protein